MTLEDNPTKYQPLLDWLALLPAEQQCVVLTLQQLALLIGQPLAPSVWASRYWGSPSMRRRLAAAGFTARFSRTGGGVVTFTRGQQ